MTRRRKNLTRHALATLAGGMAALLGGKPIPAPAADTVAPAVHARAASGVEGLIIREVRWETSPHGRTP